MLCSGFILGGDLTLSKNQPEPFSYFFTYPLTKHILNSLAVIVITIIMDITRAIASLHNKLQETTQQLAEAEQQRDRVADEVTTA